MVMNEKKQRPLTAEVYAQLEQVRELLASSTYRYESLHLLAKHVGLSVTKLKTGFKLVYGVSVYNYLLQRRIAKAKELLLQRDVSVKVIALECGFCNCQHFITTFKKWVGVTPGAYRQIAKDVDDNTNLKGI